MTQYTYIKLCVFNLALIGSINATNPSTTNFSSCQSSTISAFGMPAPERLRQLLQSEMDGTRIDTKPILLPCCYDGLTARLVAKAGFEATFMTGFGKLYFASIIIIIYTLSYFTNPLHLT